jgi:hypothetical protein
VLHAVLSPVAAALLALAPSPTPEPAGDWAWRSVLAFDEVAVDVDTLTISGTGPYMMQLRWSFHERVASPQAWDAGVRYSIDVVEIDCRAGATRTWASSAYTRAGDVVQDLSYVHDAPEWSRHRAESVGGLLARAACRSLEARG